MAVDGINVFGEESQCVTGQGIRTLRDRTSVFRSRRLREERLQRDTIVVYLEL